MGNILDVITLQKNMAAKLRLIIYLYQLTVARLQGCLDQMEAARLHFI